MNDAKVHCMDVAEKFGHQYWDGDRRYGYGGYDYIPGRWRPVAIKIIETYGLNNNSRLLDLGCGKGFLLHELQLLLPELNIVGLDCSEYGISNSTALIANKLSKFDCRKSLEFDNKSFDLVISLGLLHNFRLQEVFSALKEIDRVGKASYVMVESYRNNSELHNLQCWALTAKSFHDVDEWRWIHQESGFNGDYEFIFFE